MKKGTLVLLVISMILWGCSVTPSPESAYRQITEYAAKKDWGALYDSFDGYSKGQIDTAMKMLLSFAMAFSDDAQKEELSKLTGKDLFMRMAGSEESVKATDFVTDSNYEILKTEKRNGKAVLNIKDSNGNFQEVVMNLENGEWKLHIEGIEQDAALPSAKKKKLSLAEKVERAKQEKLAKEEQQRLEKIKQQLKETVAIAVVEKSFMKSDFKKDIYSDYVTIKLVLVNESDKDVRAVKGVLVFKDLFGDRIYSANFKYDEGIKAKSKKNWDGGFKYNQFDDEMHKLATTELSNLILEWQPQTILFEDGTKLGD